MKKRRWVAALLCAVMVFALAACGGSKNKLVGHWEAENGGRFYYIEFFGDGTYTTDRSNYQGTYSYDGNRLRLTGILVDDLTFSFKVSGKTLWLDYDMELDEDSAWKYTKVS